MGLVRAVWHGGREGNVSVARKVVDGQEVLAEHWGADIVRGDTFRCRRNRHLSELGDRARLARCCEG